MTDNHTHNNIETVVRGTRKERTYKVDSPIAERLHTSLSEHESIVMKTNSPSAPIFHPTHLHPFRPSHLQANDTEDICSE